MDMSPLLPALQENPSREYQEAPGQQHLEKGGDAGNRAGCRGWTDRIFFISDTDLDRITDMDIDLPLSVLLERHAKTFLVSPDGKMVCSAGINGSGTVIYELKEVIY